MKTEHLTRVDEIRDEQRRLQEQLAAAHKTTNVDYLKWRFGITQHQLAAEETGNRLQGEFAELLLIKRLRSDGTSTPRFAITFMTGNGVATMHTVSGAGFGFQVGNPGMREGDYVRLNITTRGTISQIWKAGE